MGFDFTSFVPVPDLAQHLDQVEAEMHCALKTENVSLNETIKRLLATRGKRLRPSLAIAIATAFDAVSSNVIRSAAAIELVHLGSIVHDDLIDKTALRRKVPTINAQEGSERALLTGDFLLAKACALAATVNAEAAELIAATICTLCEGEAAELADQFALDRSEASLMRAIRCKTGALFAAACQMGGLAARATPAELAALGTYGEQFGVVFQLVDDVLDFIGEPEKIGKPTGTDVRGGVYTLPIIKALQSPQADKIKTWLKKPDQDFTKLNKLIAQSNGFSSSLEQAVQHATLASQALTSNSEDAIIKNLQNFPKAYINWTINSTIKAPYRP